MLNKKISLLLLVILSFSCGWFLSNKYTRDFRFWLYEPADAQYIGWNKDKRTFDFKIEYSIQQGIVHCLYESLGADDDTAHIVDTILTLNQGKIAIARYANSSAVDVYIYANPPLPLSFVLPILLNAPHPANRSWIPRADEIPDHEMRSP